MFFTSLFVRSRNPLPAESLIVQGMSPWQRWMHFVAWDMRFEWLVALVLLWVIFPSAFALDTCDAQRPHITAAEVHEELERLASAGQPDVQAFEQARTGGFIFTHSYLAMSSDLVQQGIQPQYSLTPSDDGFYTRLAMRLYYGQTSDANNPQGQYIFETTVRTVSANDASDHCLRTTGGCASDTGELCEAVGVTAVRATLDWPLEVEWHLTELTVSRDLPFSYVPLDDYSYSPDFGCELEAGDYAGTTCANTASNCNGMLPCDGTSFISQSDVDALLADNCGARSDPWTEWTEELNTGNCLTACCNLQGSWHQRWGIGPAVRVYALSAPVVRTGNLTVTVTDQHGVEYSVATEFIGPGTYVVPLGGDKKIRISVARQYALPTAAIQQLEGGRVFVWGEPNQTPPEPALVPTMNFTGAGAGWAYLDPSIAAKWNTGLNGYAEGSLGTVSPQGGFGVPDNCVNNFYSSWQNVPGWYADPDAPGVPLVPSPCQISNALNELADSYAADPGNYVSFGPCSAAVQRPSIYLPPGYSLMQPNYVLDEAAGTLRRTLLTPGCGQSEVAAVELYVDISTDVMPYLSPSNTAGIDTDNSGCAFSFDGQPRWDNTTTPTPSPSPQSGPVGYGIIALTVQNPVVSSGTTTYTIGATCAAQQGSQSWGAGAVSPTGFHLVVPGASGSSPGVATAQPMRFVITPSSFNSQGQPGQDLVIVCTVTVSNADGTTEITSHDLTCRNLTQTMINADLVQKENGPKECTSIIDTQCPAHDTVYWVIFGVVCVLLAIGLVLVIMALYYLCLCITRKSGGDGKGKNKDS